MFELTMLCMLVLTCLVVSYAILLGGVLSGQSDTEKRLWSLEQQLKAIQTGMKNRGKKAEPENVKFFRGSRVSPAEPSEPNFIFAHPDHMDAAREIIRAHMENMGADVDVDDVSLFSDDGTDGGVLTREHLVNGADMFRDYVKPTPYFPLDVNGYPSVPPMETFDNVKKFGLGLDWNTDHFRGGDDDE